MSNGTEKLVNPGDLLMYWILVRLCEAIACKSRYIILIIGTDVMFWVSDLESYRPVSCVKQPMLKEGTAKLKLKACCC